MEDISARKLVTTSKLVPTIHSKFPISKSSVIDQSIENVERCTIYPEASDLNSGSAIIFMVNESPGLYIDVASLELEINLSLLKPNDARLAAGDRAYFINNLLSTLFPIRKVSIAGTNVETQYYGSYLANIKHLLEGNNESVNKIGKPRGLFALDHTKMRSPINQATAQANDERMTWSKNGDDVVMRGYLDLDICSLNKFLLDLTNIKISLEPASNPFVINSDANGVAFKKRINSIKLYVNKIRPSAGAFLSVTKSVLRDPMEYILTRNIVHSQIIAANQSSLIINRPWQNRIPQKIYLFIVKQSSDSGVYNESPLYFHHCGLSEYRVMIDGTTLVEQSCTSADGYIGPYVNSQLANENSPDFIPFHLYSNGGFLLIIKTNHSQKHELSFELKGNMSLHLKFKEALAENHVVYLVGEHHTSLQITSDRACITNYSY